MRLSSFNAFGVVACRVGKGASAVPRGSLRGLAHGAPLRFAPLRGTLQIFFFRAFSGMIA